MRSRSAHDNEETSMADSVKYVLDEG